MFDEKELALGLSGITVQDAWIAMQILDKAAGSGVIQPTEFEVVGAYRKNITEAIERGTGKNYDQMIMEARQAQMQAQQQAQQAALEAHRKAAEEANGDAAEGGDEQAV